MRLFTPLALLSAALFSVVAALPFLPAAKMQPDLFMMELRVRAAAPGQIQIFYDDGGGVREEVSGRATVAAGANATTYRVPVPPGTYQGLRFDPLDHGATLVLESMQVVAQSGRVLDRIPVQKFAPLHQITRATAQGQGLEIVSEPNSEDPQLSMVLPSPLVVSPSWQDYARDALPVVGPLFLISAGLLLLFDRSPRLRTMTMGGCRALAVRPFRAVMIVGAIAVIASAYPVVFLGKSHVSPNLGTILLYDGYPTLPGYTSGELVDVKLSDIGAVMWQHVPFSMMQHRALAEGELPLWNRYNAGGVPLLAQGQSMFGDPLHFLVIAANGAAWAWDLKYLIAKWLFASGLGLAVLTLLLSLSPIAPAGDARRGAVVAALLVAASAPFIGFFLYRVNHPAYFSLCYAPWPLYCLIRITLASTRRGVAGWCAGLVVANLALMNSGTVKEAYMLLACTNFSGACILLATRAPWRTRLVKLAALVWAGIIFVLLTTPIWATFLQTLKSAYTGYNAVSAYQIQPTLLLGAFDEIFYRPLMTKDQVFSPSLNFLLLLGVLYFLATLRLQFSHRALTALAASSLLPLSLAFGLISPQWIVSQPFLGNIAHLDNTFSCALIVLWTVLAGAGFATAAQRLGTREGRYDLIIVGLLLFALVFGWIAFRQAAHRPILGPIFTVNLPGQVLPINPFIWHYLVALLVAAAVLGLALRGALVRRSCSAARGILLTLCVATLLWRHGLHAGTIGYDAFTSRPTERVKFQAKSPAMEFARAADAREPARGFGLHGNFFPGWTGVYGLEGVHGPDALVNPWMRELASVSGVERLWDWRLYADASTIANVRPFFDALNVRFYFDRLSDQGALGQSLRLLKVADLDVYESPTAWPRAFFTDRVDLYDQPAELVTRIRAAAGRPFAAAQRSDSAAIAALSTVSGDMKSRQVAPASAYRLTENTTSFSVRAGGPGVIVLNEVLWPGDFRAEVNGVRTPVIRLNHAFKGVVVSAAGDYRVKFSYWPRHFLRSLLLCGVGAALAALSLLFALRPVRAA
jgi:hypothetical protein